MGVVRVEANEHACRLQGPGLDACNDAGIDRGTLYEIDHSRQGVLLDLPAVVCADVDVDADHPPRGCPGIEQSAPLQGIADVQKREHRSGKDERSAVRDARFDDQVRPAPPDHFLYRQHVLRILDDGPAEPAEVVGIFGIHGGVEKCFRSINERLICRIGGNPIAALDHEFLVRIRHRR